MFKQGDFLVAAGKFEDARKLGDQANEDTDKTDASVKLMASLV
jgi:hypothetical protein